VRSAEAIATPEAAASASSARLPGGVLVAYALPATGVGYLTLLVSMYLFKYATDVLLIAPAAMGVIFLVGRVWDAVSDPLVGHLSDRTRAQMGRRRPWLLAAALPLAIFSLMPWVPPAGLSGVMLALWVGAGLLLFETAVTMFYVPHTALAAELTLDHHERTRVFAFRHFATGLGFVLVAAAMQLMTTSDDKRATAVALTLGGGAATALLIVYSVSRVREIAAHSGRGGSRPLRAVVDVWRNPHSRLLLMVFLIESMGAATLGILGPYVMEYVIGDESLFPRLLLSFFLPTVLFIPIVLPLSRRLGKKNTWALGMAISGVAFGLLVFATGPEQAWIIYVSGVGAGIGGAIGAMVGPSVQADVVDYDEYLTGERKEGVYFAVWSFARKCAGGIMGVITGVVLQLVGFEPNVEQTEETKFALRSLFAFLPGAGYAIGLLLFWRFGLDEQEHARVRRELDRRNAE
jgi:GPH family glycoside/pentoside/hexuronide:cation symporter